MTLAPRQLPAGLVGRRLGAGHGGGAAIFQALQPRAKSPELGQGGVGLAPAIKAPRLPVLGWGNGMLPARSSFHGASFLRRAAKRGGGRGGAARPPGRGGRRKKKKSGPAGLQKKKKKK